MADLDSGVISEVLGVQNSEPFQERYFTLVGKVVDGVVVCEAIDEQTQGEYGSVEFDARQVEERQKVHGDVVGWFHTHPPGAHGMSGRDLRTFKAWMVYMPPNSHKYAVIACDGVIHGWELWLEGTLKTGLSLRWRVVDANVSPDDGRVRIYP